MPKNFFSFPYFVFAARRGAWRAGASGERKARDLTTQMIPELAMRAGGLTEEQLKEYEVIYVALDGHANAVLAWNRMRATAHPRGVGGSFAVGQMREEEIELRCAQAASLKPGEWVIWTYGRINCKLESSYNDRGDPVSEIVEYGIAGSRDVGLSALSSTLARLQREQGKGKAKIIE